jgi:2-C-methyl-D-erythritol 4-phosphate cytidylyltransferase
VTLVDGADQAFKITTPHDWLVAEMLLGDEIEDQR